MVMRERGRSMNKQERQEALPLDLRLRVSVSAWILFLEVPEHLEMLQVLCSDLYLI